MQMTDAHKSVQPIAKLVGMQNICSVSLKHIQPEEFKPLFLRA